MEDAYQICKPGRPAMTGFRGMKMRLVRCFLAFWLALGVVQLGGCSGGAVPTLPGHAAHRDAQSVADANQDTTLMVDAGGHGLHMRILGEGSPTIVFDAGFADVLQSWSYIQEEASKHTKTISYDRAGIGKSEAGPEPRSASRIASELRRALSNAGVPPPYILVGHSAGGLFQTVFAGTYPEDVVGLVLVDPATPEFYDIIQKAPWWSDAEREAAKLPPGNGMRGQLEALEISKEEMRRIQSLPDTIRVGIVTAMQPTGGPPFETADDMEPWRRSHETLLKIGRNAAHVVDEQSHHASILQTEGLLNVVLGYLETVKTKDRRDQ